VVVIGQVNRLMSNLGTHHHHHHYYYHLHLLTLQDTDIIVGTLPPGTTLATITSLLPFLILHPLHNTRLARVPYYGHLPRFDLYYICLPLLSLHYYNSSYSHCTTQEPIQVHTTDLQGTTFVIFVLLYYHSTTTTPHLTPTAQHRS
jgi:hypothetical protein